MCVAKCENSCFGAEKEPHSARPHHAQETVKRDGILCGPGTSFVYPSNPEHFFNAKEKEMLSNKCCTKAEMFLL